MNRTLTITLVVLVAIVAIFFLWYTNNKTDEELNQDNRATTTNTSVEQRLTRSAVVLEENEPGEEAEIKSAALSQSGFIVIFTTSTTSTDGSVRGVSNLLSAGTYSDLTIQLERATVAEETLVAVLFADDGNGVFDMGQDPYLSNQNLIIVSDVDVVGTSRGDEPEILDQQIELFIENATTTEA